MLDSALAGLLTGLSLIVAIGAQNAYVLRQGVVRAHVAPVVAVCTVSDIVLIAAGVAGVGTIVDRADGVVDVVRWLGVCFLVCYAALSLRRALAPGSMTGVPGGERGVVPGEARGTVVARAVALTWLNPHVYLDTVLLIGSVAATHDVGQAGGRWWFAAGAALASTLWFSGLGYGARALSPVLAGPQAWRVLDVLVAATMLLVAAKLAAGG